MEDFVTFEQAVQLKELGFNYPCNHYYGLDGFLHEEKESYLSNYTQDNRSSYLISAPTLAQVAKWLYEKYNLWIEVTIKAKNDFTLCVVNSFGSIKFINDKEYTDLKTPEQALSAGIDKALQLLTDKTEKK